ncbi:hypothetical protein C8R46DRAFT_550648 [Mycena filopes]|nr:hypothetical protein C8R46DRAFT_550648 [Mycena filopes]
MYDLLDQLGSVVGNIHSISDTFVVCDGINDDALFDVIILPGSKPGICFSQIPSGWDLSMVRNMDVFRRQALLPLLGNNLALRDAAYAHSRLALALPQNISSLRVLKYSTSTSTGLRLLEPGNTTYQLQPHHAIESTYNDLQLNKCMTQQLVRENMDTLEAAMEEMCQNWLIALLGVVALLPYDQKHNMVEMHKQYMDCLAAMEQEAALQAGYTHSPMTWRSYQDMTTEFQFTVNHIHCGLQGERKPSGSFSSSMALCKDLGAIDGPMESCTIFHELCRSKTSSVVLFRRCCTVTARLFQLGGTGASSKLPSPSNHRGSFSATSTTGGVQNKRDVPG